MSSPKLSVVVAGLSITSSWGNGHATTYRGLIRELCARGHGVLFLERDVPWYRHHRDLPRPPYGRTELYSSLEELQDRFADEVRVADLVIVGSFVPEGIDVGGWVLRSARGLVAFYDIDTPVTLQNLATGTCSYVTASQLRQYDLYLSFTGGPTLARVEKFYGVNEARPLYCSADPDHYYPEITPERWSIGYLGTYSADRQHVVEELLLAPARRRPDERFIVAGPKYPAKIRWPENVERRDHVPPGEHRGFYCGQRFTLNLTRRDMVQAGYSPSVRLFEAAACGTPIITDAWKGLDLFFRENEEILVARSSEDVIRHLTELPEEARRALGARACARVRRQHTAAHRAATLEGYVVELLESRQALRLGQRQRRR